MSGKYPSVPLLELKRDRKLIFFPCFSRFAITQYFSGQQDDPANLLTLASIGAELHHAANAGDENSMQIIANKLELLLQQTLSELDGLVSQYANTEHSDRVRRARALMDEVL